MSILHNTSQDMPNSSRINNMSSTIQNHLHAIKIGAFTKQILKGYLECKLNYKKFWRTSPTCLLYNPYH